MGTGPARRTRAAASRSAARGPSSRCRRSWVRRRTVVPSEANSLDNNFQLSPSAVRPRASNEGGWVRQCLQYSNDESSQIDINMKSMFQSTRHAGQMQKCRENTAIFRMQEQITAAIYCTVYPLNIWASNLTAFNECCGLRKPFSTWMSLVTDMIHCLPINQTFADHWSGVNDKVLGWGSHLQQVLEARAVMVLPFLEGPVLGLFMQKDQSFWSFLVPLQSHI